MAEPRSIMPLGNALQVIMDDGKGYVLHPTGGSLWVRGGAAVPPDPNPGGGGLVWPYPLSVVTSEFRTAARPNHDGMDFSGGPASLDLPIPSAGSGTVWKRFMEGQYGGYGNGIIVDHGELLPGMNFKTLYGHMNWPGPVVNEGDTITQGQNLGPIGNTGASRGNHLHFEVWLNGTGASANKVNPRGYVN